jgi:D-amino peptidase
MKVLMHWDMEGASGLFEREQTWYWERGTRASKAREGRELLMADINAASAAALAAGVDELLISDTHHGGGNLEPERMLQDPRITYLWRPTGYQDGAYRWLPGLDHTVDALMLPGHHAKAFTEGAFLPHGWSLEWADFRINGRSVGEMGMEACYAGHWGVPLVLMQGDEAACAEAEEQFPGVVTACVKRALSRDFCVGPDPEAARRLTAEKVGEAIARLRAAKPRPYRPTLPMTITISMASVAGAEDAAGRPGVKRVDEDTVECRVERHADVVKWINGTGLDMPPRRRP